MSWKIEQRNGLYLPDLDWHLDARKPVKQSFVSHAHFDHMGNHQTILCSPPSAKLIQQRIPGKRKWRIYEFGEPFELEPGIEACLYPAGHIVGSAMLWLKNDGQSLLYSGDFKLSPGASAETCKPVKADTLIVETTYGLPRYTFPPESEVYDDIIKFCRDTLENGDTPVLFGYSLGKSQAILRSLTEADFEVMLHPAALKLTKSCQALGWRFPPYHAFDARNQKGKVIISPPLPKSADWIQSIHNPKTAMISGWAIDPSAIYRYQCDKAFPLSDHADYLDLQSFVNEVQPKTVYTVHGFAREFADTLRQQGYDAWALGRENQLGLDIETPPADEIGENPVAAPVDTVTEQAEPNSFAALASAAEELSKTDSHREKLCRLKSLLSSLTPEDVSNSLVLFDQPDTGVLNELTAKLVRQSLILATQSTEAEFKQLYQNSRDKSQAARSLLEKEPAVPSKSLADIRSFLKTLASAPNPIFKQSILSEQFRKLSPNEGLFLYQFLTQTPRCGLTSEHLCQSIATRYGKPISEIRSAYLRCGRLIEVNEAAADGSSDSIRVRPFRPILPIKATTEPSPEAIIEKQGLSLWAEQEHDGIRCQIHKDGEHVDLYATNGERITHLYPEFVDDARMIPQYFICDAVVVPWGYEKPLPRAELDKRLSRKAEELFLGEEIPVLLWLFDILYLYGEDLIDLPLEERRRKLDTLSVTPKIRITPVRPLMGVDQIETELERVASTGNKGLVFKSPQSPYDPLSEKPIWLRIAPKNSD